MEEQFQAAVHVAGDLAAGDFAVVGDADFVGDVFVGELFFRFPNE